MNFNDVCDAQQAQALASPPGFIDDEERRAHRRGQARLLQADMGERTAAQWRRAHPKEAAAEYEFWATRAAERAERRAEREELRQEKRARKAASAAAYAALETGAYCSFTPDDERWLDIYTDTDVPTSTDDDEDEF